MKTEQEVTDLIKEWTADPHWDLAGTNGFEEHRERLAAWQANVERIKVADAAARAAIRRERLEESNGRPTTLRDQFAAAAMAAYLTAHDGDNAIPKVEQIAAYAYKLADAMLLERMKGQQ